MKKIFSLLFIASSLFFVSCDEDLTETFTPGQLTDQVAVTNSSELQRLLNSSYNILTERQAAVFTSIFTDEAAKGFNNGGQGVNTEIVFNILPADASPTAIWNSNYFALARINRVIDFAGRIPAVDAADQQLINRIKAQALTLRAFAHLNIIGYYSPNMRDDNALAGILSNRIIGTNETPLRVTNGVFYSQIHQDLDDALAIFNTDGSPSGSMFARAVFARGLKARAYAYKGDYTNAEIQADLAIASGITLATPAQYTSVFWTDSEPAGVEVIFRLKRTAPQNAQATNLHNGWCSIRPNVGGSPFYEVGRSLYNVLAANPTDVRFSTIVSSTSLIDPLYPNNPTNALSDDRIILHKHGGGLTSTAATSANNTFNNDHKVMRISEMHLIKAECRIAAGDLTGAAAQIKLVRDARFGSAQTAPVFANPTAAWSGVLAERRLELAFEGHRFIDIRRIGAAAGFSLLDRDAADYVGLNIPGANPANLPFTSHKWTLPVPQTEINANGSIQQNPGY
jgi:hypothetical protein